ncbi:MAG: hypothetical protein ABW166_15790 [Sedimenticola sp.]
MWGKILVAALLSAPSWVIAETHLPSPGFELTPYKVDLDRPARPHGGEYAGSLIDTHVHLLRGLKGQSLSEVADAVNAAGVTRMIVLPTPNEGRMRRAVESAKKRRGWVIKARTPIT